MRLGHKGCCIIKYLSAGSSGIRRSRIKSLDQYTAGIILRCGVRVCPVTLFLAQPPEGVLDQSGQLIRGTIDGFVQGRGLVSDRDGPTAFEVDFHHTAHGVFANLFVAVLVTQMDIYSRDVFAESAQGTLHYATDMRGQRLVSFDVAVGMNFDLHGILLCACVWLFVFSLNATTSAQN
jgi:hypothetical protein